MATTKKKASAKKKTPKAQVAFAGVDVGEATAVKVHGYPVSESVIDARVPATALIEEEGDADVVPVGLLTTNMAEPFDRIALNNHRMDRAACKTPSHIPHDAVLAKVHSMLVSASDIRCFHMHNKAQKSPLAFGDCYLAEVVCSADDNFPAGCFVYTHAPHGISQYIVCSVYDCLRVEQPLTQYLSAPLALCMTGADMGRNEFQAANGFAPRTQLVLGTTSYAKFVAEYTGATLFAGTKLSLLHGQSFDVVHDCRLSADHANACGLVSEGGVYVQIMPGARGPLLRETHNATETTKGHLAMFPTYSGEAFAKVLAAYHTNKNTAEILERLCVNATLSSLVGAIGHPEGLVRLTF
jgi:hypothetical protein